MEKKEIENITDFFSREDIAGQVAATPEKKWEEIFSRWIDKIEQEQMMINLFELKLWFESVEEMFASPALENLVFRYQPVNERNYEFYVFTFHQVLVRMTTLLKELDFKKDKYFLNFEEFIVEKILEDNMENSFPYLRELHAPESWFNSLRIFLQNYRTLLAEIFHHDIISQRAFLSVKKLYHRELIGNPILISLLRKQFIPKMDKIYQPDISAIIAATKDRSLKKNLGIFFVLAFRILKINNFIELNLNRSKYLETVMPLVLTLVKSIAAIVDFCENVLIKSLEGAKPPRAELEASGEVLRNLRLEYKKINEGELPVYFDAASNKIKKRRMLKNIVIISEMAIQELIESVARLFKPDISGGNIFENYVSRKQKSIEVKKKLIKLHTKINDFFVQKGGIAPSEIFFDINLFMETDLNYLLYKDWNEFLSHYNNLSRTNFSTEFEPALRTFHSFLTRILKEIVSDKK